MVNVHRACIKQLSIYIEDEVCVHGKKVVFMKNYFSDWIASTDHIQEWNSKELRKLLMRNSVQQLILLNSSTNIWT